ncbi:NUDIX hydrolase domain-like protein [Delphinella strobiligena]|nr:NUDIX hydrolase domain-like protein [Delphinella strobiligena]
MDNFSLPNLSKLRDFLPSLPQLSPSSEMNDSESQLDAATNHTTSADVDTESAAAKEANPAESEPAFLDPQPIDESKPKSNLDLINECDSFPYVQDRPTLYLQHINLYYHLQVAAYPHVTLGYILPSVAEVLRGIPGWTLDDENRNLTLTLGDNEVDRSDVVAATTAAMRETGHFNILKGWRNELYPVYGPGPKKELLFSIERAASALFGIVSYGVHLTAYTYVKNKETEEKELKLWTPRRAATKQTYGGMLDNTVAGGMATGEVPIECVIREAHEEASLPEDVVREKAKPAGTVTYFHIRDHRAGGETKLLQPECQYIFDLELPSGVEPKPCDDEVEQFYLLGVDELKDKLKAGEFKPNCAVVLLDFFVRHGVVNAENEDDFVEIVSRLHRKLEFPTK